MLTKGGVKMVILFDFDGTIADSFSIFLHCMNQFSKAYGYEEIQDSAENRKKGMRRILSEDMKISSEMILPYSDRIRDEIEENYQALPLFPAVKGIVTELLKDHTLGIVSTNSKTIVQKTLKQESLNIDLLYADISLGKKGEVLKKITGNGLWASSDFIYVGDECRDIEACRTVGIPIVAVTWGFDSREDLKSCHPDYLIDDPSGLVKIINIEVKKQVQKNH